MASVDGEYVGPLEPADCARLVDDVKAGREVLPDKQLKKRKIAVEHYRLGGLDAPRQDQNAGPDAPRR
jgi:hypothetical protein